MKFFRELLVKSHDGNYYKIVEVISNHFRGFDNCEVVIQNISGNKNNVIVIWGKPELLINAHLDTVKPSSGWHTNPYELTVKNDNYYGLGTCDTKGNIFAISEALKCISPKNLMLLFSVDEESNSVESGVTHFLDSTYEDNIKQVIVCEPTNNLIADAHKGYYSFYLKAKATSRHSSESAYLFDNAIFKLGKYFKPLIDSGYNLGSIKGGMAGNIIAPDCCLLVSIRCFNDFEEVLSDLNNVFEDEIIIEHKTILPALNSKINKRESVCFNQEINSEPLEFWTEASLFNKKGINSFIYGVGNIRQAHTPNEFVSKISLDKGINFFIEVIKGVNNK